MTNSQPLSACHKAAVHVGGDDTEGTHYYICNKCGEPCDLLPQKPEVSHTATVSDDDIKKCDTPDGSDELDMRELLFNFSWDTHLVKVENHNGKITDEESIEKYTKLYNKVESALQSLIAAKVVEARFDEWYRMNPLDDDNSLLTADGLRYLAERITALKAEQEGVR